MIHGFVFLRLKLRNKDRHFTGKIKRTVLMRKKKLKIYISFIILTMTTEITVKALHTVEREKKWVHLN